MILAACGLVWLTRIGAHSSYATDVLPPLLVDGAGIGLIIAPSINTGTFGVTPEDAGVASATVNTGQQLGGSIGTSLFNTIAASATSTYLAAHLNPRTLAGGRPSPAFTTQALIHGYITAFWWAAGIFLFGAVVAGVLFRRGPLATQEAEAAVGAGAEGAAQPRVIPG